MQGEAEGVGEAMGVEQERLPQVGGTGGLEVWRWGTVRVGRQDYQTTVPGVFAAGDIVRGASLVVWAIKDGREAAASIQQWIEANNTAAAAREQG